MKNALITGATKGMGRAIAIAFAKEGVHLAVCSRNETWSWRSLSRNLPANQPADQQSLHQSCRWKQ